MMATKRLNIFRWSILKVMLVFALPVNALAGMPIRDYAINMFSNTAFFYWTRTLNMLIKSEMAEITFEYVHACGENEGEEMKCLPIFTPNDGIGCSEPIYDIPEPPLLVIFDATPSPENIDSLTATFCGRELTMQETTSDSLRFESGDGTRVLEFDETPPNICQITDTMEGITDAGYLASAVEGAELTFEAFTPRIEITTSPWKENKINEIVFDGEVFSETETGSRVFFNETYGYEITILDGAEQTPEVDKWRILLSYGFYAQDALFTVEETDTATLVFQNCDPPISTDSPPLEPEDFVPWRVKVTGVKMDWVESLTIKSPTESIVVDAFEPLPNGIMTKAVFVLVPLGTTPEQVPGGDYKLLHTDPSLISTVPDPSQAIKSCIQLVTYEERPQSYFNENRSSY